MTMEALEIIGVGMGVVVALMVIGKGLWTASGMWTTRVKMGVLKEQRYNIAMAHLEKNGTGNSLPERMARVETGQDEIKKDMKSMAGEMRKVRDTQLTRMQQTDVDIGKAVD